MLPYGQGRHYGRSMVIARQESPRPVMKCGPGGDIFVIYRQAATANSQV